MRNKQVLSWKITMLVTGVFAALGTFGILHHEIWLDEAHHWLLAKDSNSMSEMLYNARYEGHPALWNVLLFVLSRFSSDPFSMQVLNLVIATTAVCIFLRFSPFKLFITLGVVFSYFIFYEYTVISRNYALAFLLLVLACILFRERQKRFFLFVVILVLLSQVHLFAAVIAAGFFTLSAWEYFFTTDKEQYRHFYFGAFLILISFALVIYQAIPPDDHFLYGYDSDRLFSFNRIGKAFSVLLKGFFPLPDFFSSHPWNSNLFISFSKQLAIIPAALAWLIPVILLHNRKAIVFFYFSAFVLVLFIYISPLIVASRHCGFFFLLLIASLWIDNYFDESEKTPENTSRIRKFSAKFAKPLLATMLLVQVISGIYLYVVDWNRPFSNAKQVAEWINENVDPQKRVIVNDHFAGPPVRAYFLRNIYYAENNAEGSFCKWNTDPFMISRDTLFFKVSRLLYNNPGGGALWLVSNKPLTTATFDKYPGMKKFKLELVVEYSGALVRAEEYWIYNITSEWKYEKHIY
ncbi:MAG: alkaline shock response membrane anchor protein AmaP [Bacteroidota bacterium]|nr:alkaline shock response membrane anchor protein AmaP [Bacteroidota bacterium]